MRVPASLADYGCQRSQVCCSGVWVIGISDTDTDRITDQLSVPDAHKLASIWHANLAKREGLNVLRQPGGRCGFLAESPGCQLHAYGGLAGLPRACRNFPRSVIQTPAGIEIAFTTGCPTVARLISTRSAPFEWAELPDDEQYSIAGVCGEQLQWSRGADMTFAELEALRTAWWAVFAKCDSVLAVLHALAENPGDPTERSTTEQPLNTQFGRGDLRALNQILDRLPRNAHAHRRALWRALSQPIAEAELADFMPKVSLISASAAGLLIQAAGVHDLQPVSAGLGAIAPKIFKTLALAHALSALCELSPVDAMTDALTVSGGLQSQPVRKPV